MALYKHLRPVPATRPFRGPRRFPAPHNLRKGMPGTEHNGRFLLQQLLGCGGVCEVYAALDLRRVEWSDASPQVAVKRLLPELTRNYQAQLALAQEFCILRHLVHPGVVRVFDLHNEPFGLCYSMELLQGRNAGEIRPGDLPGAALATMAARFFDALAFLHAQGIAHGDIKPANLLLKSGERPVLIDFNVAAASVRKGGTPAAVGLRESLRVPAHSLLYSSPERLEGGSPSREDDIFSACCTVHEVFSGAHPFKRLSSTEARQQDMVPGRPSGIPPFLWPMLRRGLAFQAQARPDAASLRRAFAAWSALCNCTGQVRNFFTP